MTHQSRADRDAELWAFDQTSHEAAQNRSLRAKQPVKAPSGVRAAEGAREARYAEAIHKSAQALGVSDFGEDDARFVAIPVAAMADAEVAAAVSEAQAEVERLREVEAGIRALADRADKQINTPRYVLLDDLRALLSPSPAATTGEAEVVGRHGRVYTSAPVSPSTEGES